MTVAVTIAAGIVVGGASAAWYWWPREVAPGLTPQMVRAVDRSHWTITPVGGGSRRDAHTLWARYHGRAPYGEPPTAPRLRGISLADVSSGTFPGSGRYWVVFSDRVWNPSLGPDSTAGGFGREVVLVDPDSLAQVASTLS